MGPLMMLSVSLLALKLGAVSTVGWGLILLPASLQGVYNLIKAYRQKRELDIIIQAIEQAKKNIKEE